MGRQRVWQAILLVIYLAAGVEAARAQAAPPAPNPGLILNENERNRQQMEQRNNEEMQAPAIVIPPTAPAMLGEPGGPTVLLRSVTFDASVFLSKEELDAIAARYVGKDVDAYQIQLLVKAVNDFYAQKGVVTALAFLPEQDLQTGQLRVGLVEGRLGMVTIRDNKNLPADAVAAAIPAQPGAVIDVPKLGADVARFNRTHNAQLQASLQPGESFGLTDIALSVIEPPINVLQLFIDNQGVTSVGELEGGVNFQRYGLLGRDDKLTLYGAFSEGDRTFTGAYNLPFNRSGGRLGISASLGTIRIVQGPYESLHVRGHSDSFGLNGSQPIFIDQNWQILFNASVARGFSASSQDGTVVTHDITDKSTFGLTLGYLTQSFSTSISPNFSFADTRFKVTDLKENFYTFNGTAFATWHPMGDYVVTFAGAWQVANETLIPGDQLFQAGGPTTVRGYPTGAVAGYTGYYGNLELHHPLNTVLDGLDVFGFYDRGEIFSTFPKDLQLNSLGLGSSWDSHKNIIAELSAGFPVTHTVDHQLGYEIYFRLTSRFE